MKPSFFYYRQYLCYINCDYHKRVYNEELGEYKQRRKKKQICRKIENAFVFLQGVEHSYELEEGKNCENNRVKIRDARYQRHYRKAYRIPRKVALCGNRCIRSRKEYRYKNYQIRCCVDYRFRGYSVVEQIKELV